MATEQGFGLFQAAVPRLSRKSGVRKGACAGGPARDAAGAYPRGADDRGDEGRRRHADRTAAPARGRIGGRPSARDVGERRRQSDAEPVCDECTNGGSGGWRSLERLGRRRREHAIPDRARGRPHGCAGSAADAEMGVWIPEWHVVRTVSRPSSPGACSSAPTPATCIRSTQRPAASTGRSRPRLVCATLRRSRRSPGRARRGTPSTSAT